MNDYFTYNLKYLRNKSGMYQLDLAKKMNKDYSTIGKWESGQRNPTMKDVIKLAEIFDVSVQDLVEKDLCAKNNDELEALFLENLKILTQDDRDYIKFIIEKRKKELEKK